MIGGRLSDTPICSLVQNPYVITAEGQTKQMLPVWCIIDQTAQNTTGSIFAPSEMGDRQLGVWF